MDLDELYARLALEEEEDEGVVVAREDSSSIQKTYVLIGRFLAYKNINFKIMHNVMASLWRPKKGMEIHEIGEHRYSFVFYHVLDIKKVVEGGPWTFKHSALVYHQLQDGEDPNLVHWNRMDIWLQVYDIPNGLMSHRILQSIGSYVGKFVKSDPTNIDGSWRMYARIRITLDIDKPLKRKMKLKHEGGEWN
ncbi:uncharacterized protein LOC141673434 [Apium graveolens]|uniref:uncharacterized protein LOC141673434 n=1 Tax=Apium graveolens TaxID=4045 RepID=UPI003D78F082